MAASKGTLLAPTHSARRSVERWSNEPVICYHTLASTRNPRSGLGRQRTAHAPVDCPSQWFFSGKLKQSAFPSRAAPSSEARQVERRRPPRGTSLPGRTSPRVPPSPPGPPASPAAPAPRCAACVRCRRGVGSGAHRRCHVLSPACPIIARRRLSPPESRPTRAGDGDHSLFPVCTPRHKRQWPPREQPRRGGRIEGRRVRLPAKPSRRCSRSKAEQHTRTHAHVRLTSFWDPQGARDRRIPPVIHVRTQTVASNPGTRVDVRGDKWTPASPVRVSAACPGAVGHQLWSPRRHSPPASWPATDRPSLPTDSFTPRLHLCCSFARPTRASVPPVRTSP